MADISHLVANCCRYTNTYTVATMQHLYEMT